MLKVQYTNLKIIQMICGNIIITVKQTLQLFYILYQPYTYNIHTSLINTN